MTSRNFVFTLNNFLLPEDFEFEDFVKYCIWQHEEKSTKHTQGYIELHNAQRFTKLQKMFGTKGHFESRKGTREQARDYCRKEDSRIAGPFEFGDFERGGQGTRNDLSDAIGVLKETRDLRQVAELHPNTFVKYHKGLEAFRNITNNQKRDSSTPNEVALHFGPPGTGKSFFAHKLFETHRTYNKGPSTKQWWDGYSGESHVIIDEFRGNGISYTSFLAILDRYPHKVEIKGSTMEFMAKHFIITSNWMPHEWYDGEKFKLEAITRRINVFRLFYPGSKEKFKYSEFNTYEDFAEARRKFDLDGTIEGETKEGYYNADDTSTRGREEEPLKEIELDIRGSPELCGPTKEYELFPTLDEEELSFLRESPTRGRESEEDEEILTQPKKRKRYNFVI